MGEENERASEESTEEKIFIVEAAERLNRRPSTLRKWQQLGVLPEDLLPKRNYRGWRYWNPEQIKKMRQWIRDTDRHPGKGLPYYNPTEEALKDAMKAMRKPRPRRDLGIRP